MSRGRLWLPAQCHGFRIAEWIGGMVEQPERVAAERRPVNVGRGGGHWGAAAQEALERLHKRFLVDRAVRVAATVRKRPQDRRGAPADALADERVADLVLPAIRHRIAAVAEPLGERAIVVGVVRERAVAAAIGERRPSPAVVERHGAEGQPDRAKRGLVRFQPDEAATAGHSAACAIKNPPERAGWAGANAVR